MIFVGAVLVIFLIVTKNIRYYEVLSLPGETRGYIGRKSKILESEEDIEQVFDKLKHRKEFKGGSIYFHELSINNRRINAVIQDSNTESNFDNYIYDGTRLFKPSWRKGDPYKMHELSIDRKLIDINELSPKGIHKFYTKINNYLREHDIELSKDNLIYIRVDNYGYGSKKVYEQIDNILEEYNVELPEDHPIRKSVDEYSDSEDIPITLSSSVSGLREDLSFKSDINGDNFEVNSTFQNILTEEQIEAIKNMGQ